VSGASRPTRFPAAQPPDALAAVADPEQ